MVVGLNRSLSSSKKRKCPEQGCGKAFSRPSHLIRHLRVHTGEKPYECKHSGCNQTFSRKHHLNQHRRAVHERKKPYKCEHPDCGKAFSHKGDLNKHRRAVHEGQKPYKCEDCGKAFSRKVTLNRHRRAVHEGKKPYKCKDCGKAFSRKGHFKQHQLTHKNCNCTPPMKLSLCRTCNPKGFCACGKTQIRNPCPECTPVDKLLARADMCSGCCETRVSTGAEYCAKCNTKDGQRLEHRFVEAMYEHIPDLKMWSAQDDVVLGGASCPGESKSRPDLVYVTDDRYVVVEIDEDSHNDRASGCENAKIDKTHFGSQNGDIKAFAMIRVNPTVKNDKDDVGMKKRAQQTAELLYNTYLRKGDWIEEKKRVDDSGVKAVVHYLFYKPGHKHVQAAQKQQQFLVKCGL